MKLQICLVLLKIIQFCSILCTPLDDYVNKQDGSYKYEIINTIKVNGFTQYFLNMTSQTWLNPNLVSQSIWFHYLVITFPDKVDTEDFATLYIGSGHNGDPLPTQKDKEVEITLMLALSTGLITAVLKQIPNQPITFSEDPNKKRRTEGGLIAYTWSISWLTRVSLSIWLHCL